MRPASSILFLLCYNDFSDRRRRDFILKDYKRVPVKHLDNCRDLGGMPARMVDFSVIINCIAPMPPAV